MVIRGGWKMLGWHMQTACFVNARNLKVCDISFTESRLAVQCKIPVCLFEFYNTNFGIIL